jgi:hypothetical protein
MTEQEVLLVMGMVIVVAGARVLTAMLRNSK